MLLKYLNDLEMAVQQALDSPEPEQYHQCLECVARLESYLQSQLEPVREKGFQIMGELLPRDISEWQMPESRELPHRHQ